MAIGIGGSIRGLGVSRGPRPGTISPANRGGDTPTPTASSRRRGGPAPIQCRTVDERRSPASAIARGGRSSGRGIPSECRTAWTSASRTPRAASGPGRAEGPRGARPGRSAGGPSPGGAGTERQTSAPGVRRPASHRSTSRMPNPRCRSRAKLAHGSPAKLIASNQFSTPLIGGFGPRSVRGSPSPAPDLRRIGKR